ncbi:MAG TPA: membrane protein insertion efficiency factor YidD [Bacteroidetes bacterium]|nr:MAG: membrane protein insertion efficiency factor YidD [Rhodothermaeota bacterium MED-G64]RPF78919.1 MAG: membrane protein insertion efficiency factor YidD [Rhodothermaceae bacterium TMED105]HBD42807.1 membrane protein insertion efficiency factor YidD [Bacteroidota bacterium]HBW00290.1 membrane protein insertion efficiency factor YidD [Bacteroidota bacterium]
MSKGLAEVAVVLIRGYQWILSPWLGRQCRFHPTCSEYSIQALREWGVMRGSWLAIKRILRCQPWTKSFGEDPVPKRKRS